MKLTEKTHRKLVSLLLAAVLSLSLLFASGETTSVSASIAISTSNTNMATVYNYLSNAGYNNAAICGILACFYRESGCQSQICGNKFKTRTGYTDASYTKAVDDGSYTTFCTDNVGYGLAMWTHWTCKTRLYNLAKSKGTSVGNIYTQLELLVSDLKTNTAGTYLRSVPNTAEGAYTAGYYFCYYYEIPADRASCSAGRGNLAKSTFWPVFGTATASSAKSGSQSDTTSTYTTGTYEVTAASLTVRSGADTSYKSLGTIKKGAQYKVTAVSGRWGKITYNSKTGYISLKYCKKATSSSTSSSSGSSSTSSGTSYKVTASTLTVRSGRGTAYKSLATIKKGTTITVSDISSGWGKTTYGGQTGYVCMQYCEKVSSGSTSASSSSTSSSSSSGTSYKVTASTLTVRSGRGTSYKSLVTIKKGTTITVSDISSGWGKTTYGGKTGYVCMQYCEKASSSSTGSTTTGTKYTVTASTLTVRSGKGTSYEALVNIPKGTTVTVTEVSGSWGKTTYKSKTGWIYLNYCTKQ